MADSPQYDSAGNRLCDPEPPPPCPPDTCCPDGGGGGGGGGCGSGGGDDGGGCGFGQICPNVMTLGVSTGPIQYSSGTILMAEMDVTAGIPGFAHSRIWRNTTVDNQNYDGPNGFNWDVAEWPYLVRRTYGGKITINVRISSGQLRVDKIGSDYVIRHSSSDWYTFTHDAANHLFILTCKTVSGVETTYFHDFDQTTNPVGLFSKKIDTNGFVTLVDSYTSGGNIEKLVAFRDDQRFELDYDYLASGANVNRVRTVVLNQIDQYPDPTLVTPLRRTRYVYYDGSNNYGLLNDLEAAILQKTTGNPAPNDWEDIAVSYYRYYKTNDGPGYPHGLKYVVNPASYAELVAAGQDPLAGPPVGDDLVPAYADHYFEYETLPPSVPLDEVTKSHRVVKEIARACAACGSSGGTSDTGETFTRTTNPAYPVAIASSDYRYNTWKTKTVSQNSGTYETIIYANRTNQVMLQVIRELGTSSSRQWCTYYEYDELGRLILQAEASAVTGFDENRPDLVGKQPNSTYVYLRNTDGLIRMTTYYASTTATSTIAGGVKGWLEYKKIKQGIQGTEIKLSRVTYIESDNTTGEVTYAVAASTVYRNDTTQDATSITTSYSYLWYPPNGDAPARMKQRITTLPTVPSTQNGDGTTVTTKEYFDELGNLTWQQNERGIITTTIYDTVRGLPLARGDDMGGAVGLPPGWSATPGTHFAYITDYEYDELGRQTLVLGPSHTVEIAGVATSVRTATYATYLESAVSAQGIGDAPVGDQTRAGHGYATESSGSYTYYLTDPVTIQFTDKLGRTLDRVVSKRSTGSGRLNDTDTFLRANWSRWSVMSYTVKGQLEYQREYFDIPSQSPDEGLDGINNTPGTASTNYYETFYGYDSQSNMRVRMKAANGTITRTIFDSINRAVAKYVGTDDVPTGGTWEEWTPSAPGTNLVHVGGWVHDNGNAGGMSNVTTAIAVVDASSIRQTAYIYDFRNRQTVTDGEETVYTLNVYDNLDRVVHVDRHDTTASGNLIDRSETLFDNRGRVYQAKQYEVDSSTGSLGNELIENITYDAGNNLIRSVVSGSGIKATYSTYDNLSRRILTAVGYDDAAATNGRVVAEQSSFTYDAAGNVLNTATAQPNTGSAITSQTYRTSYQGFWYDGINRQISTAQFGVLTSFVRPTVTPTRSDTVLVTTMGYDDAGTVYSKVDPLGRETRSFFDHLGRTVKLVENFTGAGTPSTPDADDNRTKMVTYTPIGRVATLTAVMASSSNNQVTTYAYGVSPTDGSDITTNDLLRETVYPDGTTGTDSVRQSYNRQGQVTARVEQTGTTHEYRYDGLARLRHDIVTSFGANVDTAIRRLTMQYEVRGMVSVLSSCMTATPDSSASGGGVSNQVALTYNGFGQLVKDQQSHTGAVVSTDPSVQYGYADGTDNNASLTSTTYPSGRVVTRKYGASGSIDAGLLRVSGAQDSETSGSALLAYSYLGQGTLMRKTFVPLAAGLDLWGGTGGTYAGLDLFNRVIDQNWTNGTVSTSRYQYGYDRNSSRLWRADLVAQAAGKNFDELYAYDGLDRLTDMQRGLLNSTKTAMQSGTESFEQQWGLDPLGNWSSFKEDNNGIGSFDLVQARSNNKVNEITGITESTGPSWVTPSYDPSGNTIIFPQGVDPTQEYQAVYDAWNRLVKVTKNGGATKVAGYAYDARNYRIRRRQYNESGNFTLLLDDYWSNRWQLLETRTTDDPNDVGTEVQGQYVWGQSDRSYVDELVLRDRDVNGSGTLDERMYVNQDAIFSVTAIMNTSGVVKERYAYAPYGMPQFYTGGWVALNSLSDYNWMILYQGGWSDTSGGPTGASFLYYFRNRWLSPVIGAWLQRDSQGYIDGLNLYQIVSSSPTKYADPLGFAKITVRCYPIDGIPCVSHCGIVYENDDGTTGSMDGTGDKPTGNNEFNDGDPGKGDRDTKGPPVGVPQEAIDCMKDNWKQWGDKDYPYVGFPGPNSNTSLYCTAKKCGISLTLPPGITAPGFGTKLCWKWGTVQVRDDKCHVRDERRCLDYGECPS